MEVTHRGKTIAEVLALTVDAAEFLSAVRASPRRNSAAVRRSASDIATELQRARRGHALLLRQSHRLVDAGNGRPRRALIAAGPPVKVAKARRSATAPCLAARLARS